MKSIHITVKPSKLQAEIQTKGDKANLNLNGSVVYSPLDCSTTINQTVKDTITRNGHYDYTYSRLEYTGLDSVVLDVNVPSDQLPTQDKSVVYNDNGEYTILPDDGYALSGVDVSVAIDTSIYYEEGRIVGRAEGYNQGYNEGEQDGYNEGYPAGEAAQKAKLTSLDVSLNGLYEREDGYNSVNVNVPIPTFTTQSKSVVITENGTTTITPDVSYDGLSQVDISTNIDTSTFFQEGYDQGVDDQKAKLIALDVTSNGYYHRVDGFSEVTVDVPIPTYNSQAKSVVITQNGETSVLPDASYDGLSRVDISTNIDTSIYYQEGYSDGQTVGYNSGYTDGSTAGVAYQKSLLDSSTFTANGQYTRENGWNNITVNVPSTPLVPTQSKSVSYDQNGEYSVLPDQGYNLSQVDVSVNINTQEYYDQGYEDGSTAGITYQKSLLDSSTFTANGQYSRENGWGTVTVNVPSTPPVPTQTKSVTYTVNDTYNVYPDSGYNLSGVEVTVDVPSTPGGSLQAKTTDASVNNITITPDASYYGLSEVTVNGVDASIDSNIQPGNIKEGVTILGVQGTYSADSSTETVEYYIYDSLTHNNDGLYDTGIPVTLTTIVEYQGTTLDDGNITHGVYTQNDGNSEFRLFGAGQQFYYDRREGDHRLVGGYNDGSTHVIEAGNFYLKVDGNIESQGTTITENDEYAKYSDANICVFGAYTLQDMSQYSLANGEVTVNYFKIYDGSTLVRELVPAEDASGNVGLFDKVEQVFYPNLESGTGTLGDYVETITVGGGGDMHPQQKTVDASTERVIVTPDTSLGYNALSRVTINPVTAAIDSDIIPENIRLGVNVLGVEGIMSATYNGRNQAKVVDSSTVSQTITYDSPDYTGLSEVVINPYNLETVTVDSSTAAQTIEPTINYDGIESVTINPYVLDNKTVDASTSPVVVTSSEDGLASVTIRAVDASIDPNIIPENIKAGVNILGVTGELTDDTQVDLQDKTITVDSSAQIVVTADSSYDGLGTVYVNLGPTESVTLDSSTELQTVTPSSGYIGLSQVTVTPYQLQDASVDSSSSTQVITPSSGYDGLSSVTVNPFTLQSKSANPSTSLQVIAHDASYDGLSAVTINPVTAAIDSNIQPQNIVNGITILGVQGTYSSPSSAEDGYEEIWNRLRLL